MNYTWTITAGGHTIRFTGSNANGSVSQQWDINGGLGGNVAGSSAHINLPLSRMLMFRCTSRVVHYMISPSQMQTAHSSSLTFQSGRTM